MLNNPRIQVLAVFLITVMMALGMLFIVANPFPRAPVATATASDPCAVDPALCAPTPVPYIEPTATMRPLGPQCGQNGESYQVRYTTSDPQPSAPTEYATYTSPDGKTLFYKEGEDVFVRKGDGESVKVGSDAQYTDIVNRVFWSPNSRYVLMTPRMDNHPLLVNAETGKSTILTEIENPFDFQGWSPDGNHFLFGNGDYSTVGIWSAANAERTYSTQNTLQNFRWSPDGQWLAYFWYAYTGNSDTEQGMGLAAVDGSAEYLQTLITPEQNSIYDVYEEQQLYWAANSQFVAVKYYMQPDNQYREYLTVLKTSGAFSKYESQPFTIEGFSVPEAAKQLNWLTDQTRFTFAQVNGDDQFDWMLYDPASEQTTPLAPNLYKPPFYSPSGQQVGLYARSNAGYRITLTDAEHRGETSFIEGASDAGDPDWSPDEQWVAAVWATGEGDARRVTLSWMHPDGSGRQDVDADFKDVRELRWMAGGRKLAYIAWRGEAGNSIEVVDMTSGERQVLASGLNRLENPVYDAEQDTVSFWWELADGVYGKDSYRSDGTPVEHFPVAGDFERPRHEFWSPDGSTVAIKLDPLPYRGLYDQMLVLAYRDGSRSLIARSGLDGLGDPSWSPDSRQVVFTQWVQNSTGPQSPSLFILANTGRVIWYEWNFEMQAVEWSRCG